MSPSEQTYIPFTIRPQVLSSDDTNKEYNISIIVYSNNTLPLNKSLSVFVPFKANFTINDSTSQFFNKTFSDDFMISFINLFCAKFPDSIYCKPQVIEKVIYQSPPVPYTYTQEDIAKNERRTNEVFANIERYDKDIHTQMSSVVESTTNTKNNIDKITADIDLIKSKQISDEEDYKSFYTVIITLFILIAISGIIYLIYRLINKKLKTDFEYKT